LLTHRLGENQGVFVIGEALMVVKSSASSNVEDQPDELYGMSLSVQVWAFRG
jgi:hypothetical protein